MCVVPRIVIHQGRPICHSTNLIPIIPPRHDLGLLGCVLSEPAVGLSVVIDDVLTSVGKSAGEHNGRRGVSIGRDPCAVKHEKQQVSSDDRDNRHLWDIRINSIDRASRWSQCILHECCCALDCIPIRIAILLRIWNWILSNQISVEDAWQRQGRSNTNDRCQGQH